MKNFFLGLLVMLLIIVGVLAYIGVVPFISPLITKPRDLGVKTDKSLVTAFEKKNGYDDGSGKVKLDVKLSSEEITSVFAVWEDRDQYFPLKNVQVKFNPDGTGEASGILKLSTAVALAKNLGYTDSDIEKGKKYVQYVAGDLPFYFKGTGGMTSNTLVVSPSELVIGRVSVPEYISTPLKSAVADMINRRLKQIGGADIREASFATGVFHLEGTVPSTIKY